MGDSDEEYDRRRRDKFRGERNDYDNRRPPKGYDRGRGRHENNWERGSKRDYHGNKDSMKDRRDMMGRNVSPPTKKVRRDWENNDQSSWKSGYQESNVLIPAPDKGSVVPSFMSFKSFVMQQDDDIDEMEAVRRYQEYKVEYKRTQINDFFVLHKGEEWFKEKYHPVESVDRKRFVRNALRKRLKVFLDLWEQGYMDNFSLDIADNEVVLKLLDRVVVKLEGGTDEDVKAIDLPPPEPSKDEKNNSGEIKKEIKKEEEDGEEKEPLPPGVDEDEDEPLPPGVDEEEKTENEAMEMEEDSKEGIKDNKDDVTQEKKYVYDGLHLKRPLSIFMRTLPASVTKADLEGVCKRYPGFLRVAMSEPFPDRRYSRHSWATFESSVNIKDICWNLSNIRIKDMDLAPVVNRDVTNRVRAVTGITCSPLSMQQDVLLALKLLKKLDEKHKLYVKEEPYPKVEKTENTSENPKEGEPKPEEIKNEEEEKENGENEIKKEEEDEELNIPEENPVLKKMPENVESIITGLDIEDEEDGKKEHAVSINQDLMKALDLVLLYLRIVHCVDYYNGNEYAHEEEMPVKCGIMHIRGNATENTSKQEVQDWFKPNMQKLEHLLKDDEHATKEEAEKFGRKNEEAEVENFIKANTQELAKDKWLCPLSGKKFRGPEFIRKHILMKHTGAVEDVKLEVQYFNNYVYDMKRPCFPEPQPRTTNTTGGSNKTSNMGSGGGRQWVSGNRQTQVVFAQKPSSYMPAGYQPTTPQIQSAIAADTYGRVNTYPPKAKRGGFHDRRLIRYRDLDAPEESDFF